MGRKIKDIPVGEFRAMLIEKLGLDVSATADDETLSAVLSNRLVELAERDVDAAIASGQILAAHRDFWLKSFRNNHIPARAALNALAPRVHGPAARAAVPSIRAAAPTVPARPAGPVVSEETRANAQADSELWAIGFRDGLKPPPQPEWYELYPPKDV